MSMHRLAHKGQHAPGIALVSSPARPCNARNFINLESGKYRSALGVSQTMQPRTTPAVNSKFS
jgi:hypothetical protein